MSINFEHWITAGIVPYVKGTLRDHHGFESRLPDEICENIVRTGFMQSTLPAAFVLTELACYHQPITVRGLMYRAVSRGIFPDTSDKNYERVLNIVLKLRRAGILPYKWIVDSTRRRLKPSSWSELKEFVAAAARSYRLNLWAGQATHVEIFSEKDAMAGIIEPVTAKWDVHLNIIRGEVSETFAWNIAEQWKQISKPIFAYYLGDHDPSGLRIERTIERKLRDFTDKDFEWDRLAVTLEDFANDELLGFRVKRTGAQGAWLPYLEEHGDRCVEVDAIDPSEIRARVETAIRSHINKRRWKARLQVEQRDQKTLNRWLRRL